MIPNLFTKELIPEEIPEELSSHIQGFSKNKEEFLRESFFFIVNHWKECRINLVLKFPRLFQTDVSKLLKTEGYMHCTMMNYLLRVMAVHSRLFQDKDVINKMTHSWYVAPHQYLEVRLSSDKMITLDPWNYQFGIDYGKFGSGFDSVKLCPVR